jgi:hypothetical protein
MTELTYTVEITPDAATLESWDFSVAYAEYDHAQGRHAYDWNVTLDGTVLATSVVDWDSKLRAGCSGPYDQPESLARMLGSLFSFLGAWAEALEYSERTGTDSENGDLFGSGLYPMLDRFSSDDLSIMGSDIEGER